MNFKRFPPRGINIYLILIRNSLVTWYETNNFLILHNRITLFKISNRVYLDLTYYINKF